MTNFYVTYTFADKETRDKFFEEVKACGAIEKSNEEEGCIRYEYYYPAASDRQMFLWEQWETRVHQKHHLETAHYKEFNAIKIKYDTEVDILIEDQIIECDDEE